MLQNQLLSSTNYLTAAIAEGLAERQAAKDDETEDVDDGGEKAPRFALEEDEDKSGGRRGKPAAQTPRCRVRVVADAGQRRKEV